MQLFHRFSPKQYLAGAMVLGCFEVIDGFVALAGYRSSVTTAFSLLELLWFLVSLIFVLVFQKQGLKIFVPLMYITYYAFSWLYGSYLLTQKQADMTLQLPDWFMWLATGFGLLYLISAYFHYQKLFRKNS